MDDEWELRKVRVPDGTHLSKSSGSDGADRNLLREDGTNRLLGPTESVAADGTEPFGYEWEYRMVRVPKGTHLSRSKDADGVERDLLREDGTNKLLGRPESVPADHVGSYDDWSQSAASPGGADDVRLPWYAESTRRCPARRVR